MSVVLGLQTAHDVWCALEHAYSHDSLDRMYTLRDSLRQLQNGTSTVADYGRNFKSICDQLAAIGHPVDDIDKNHWFLCGLGSSFEMFSTTQRAIKPRPSFRDLLSQAESHELFLNSVHGSSSPSPAAFTAQPQRRASVSHRGSSSTFRGRGCSFNHDNRGRGRLPHCQLCRKSGHYATACPDLPSFAQRTPSIDANLAQAFHAKCHVTDNSPDWYMDSGASAHMTASPSNLDSTSPYVGNEHVTFGNESSHKGSTSTGTP